VFSPIAWHCNVFSSGAREIRGEARWLAPKDARINENIWLQKLRLAFYIRVGSSASENEAEGPIGRLQYCPTFEAPELGVKHGAGLEVDLHIEPKQFDDLWDRDYERIPQRVFIEVEGFKDQFENWSGDAGDKIWELNPTETGQVLIKTCTFQNIAELATDRTSLRQQAFFGEEVIADVPSFIEHRLRERPQSNKPHQHDAILRDLYASISREFTRPGEVYRSELDEELTKVEYLVDDLDLALNQQAIKEMEEANPHGKNPSKKHLWIWSRGNPVTTFQEGLKSPSRRLVDRDELNTVTRKYLETPYLRSDLLEWIIVDAFVLYEIQEFGENVKRGAGVGSHLRYLVHYGRLGAGVALWSSARALLILAGWIAGLVYMTPYAGEGTLETLLVFSAYVLFFMWLTGRPIFVSQAGGAHKPLMLLQEMIKVYALLNPEAGVISPYAIRNALLKVQTEGAVWDAAALAVLDTAVARSRPAWLLH
jgi:hypothetical protein